MSLFKIRELGDVQSGDGNDLRLRASQQKTVTTFPAGIGAQSLPKIDEEVEYEDDDEEYNEDDYAAAEDTKSAKFESAKKHDEKLAALVKDKDNKIEIEKTSKNININKSADGKIFSQHSPTQKQATAIADPNQKYSLVQTQNGKSVYQPETTEKIPEGFSGRILTEKKVEKSVEPPKKIITRFLPSKHLENRNNDAEAPKNPDSYVTLTKSVSGSLDDKAPTGDGKFASTYYTKTSTCGYFTFSCNIVYGQNGRSKICRPKTPGNGKC